MDARRLVTICATGFSLALFLVSPLVSDTSLLKWLIAGLLVIAILALVAPAVSRPYWQWFFLVAFFVSTGVAVDLFVEGLSSVMNLMLTAPFIRAIPYANLGLNILSIVISLVVVIILPICAVLIAERVVSRKWLWGVYLTTISVFVTALHTGPLTAQSLLLQPTSGAILGFVCFVLAERLVGYNLKDYSYAVIRIRKSQSEIVRPFTNRSKFLHIYRRPIVIEQNPLSVDLKATNDSPHCLRVFGRFEKNVCIFQVIAFTKRLLTGKLVRTPRSDSLCNDVVAIICKELRYQPSSDVVPGSRPTVPDTGMEGFALRESLARLPSIVSGLVDFLFTFDS